MATKPTKAAMRAILQTLDRHEPASTADIRGRCGLHSSSVYLNLRSLVTDGLAAKHQRSTNEYAKYLITRDGEKWLEQYDIPPSVRERKNLSAALELARCLGYRI